MTFIQANFELKGNEVCQARNDGRAEISLHATQVARAALLELDALMQQRAELVKRIGAVKQTLIGLTSIFDCSVEIDHPELLTPLGAGSQVTGLTDACRRVLMQADAPLLPHQVRDRLRFEGLSLESHRDPVATVTTVLRRLGQYGEARAVTSPKGKRAWQWATTENQNPAPE